MEHCRSHDLLSVSIRAGNQRAGQQTANRSFRPSESSRKLPHTRQLVSQYKQGAYGFKIITQPFAPYLILPTGWYPLLRHPATESTRTRGATATALAVAVFAVVNIR